MRNAIINKKDELQYELVPLLSSLPSHCDSKMNSLSEETHFE